MRYYVYALQSLKDEKLYIGITKDVERRLAEHNAGQTRSTKHRRPFRLVYKEECDSRVNARHREVKLKSGSGREFLKQFL